MSWSGLVGAFEAPASDQLLDVFSRVVGVTSRRFEEQRGASKVQCTQVVLGICLFVRMLLGHMLRSACHELAEGTKQVNSKLDARTRLYGFDSSQLL